MRRHILAFCIVVSSTPALSQEDWCPAGCEIQVGGYQADKTSSRNMSFPQPDPPGENAPYPSPDPIPIPPGSTCEFYTIQGKTFSCLKKGGAICARGRASVDWRATWDFSMASSWNCIPASFRPYTVSPVRTTQPYKSGDVLKSGLCPIGDHCPQAILYPGLFTSNYRDIIYTGPSSLFLDKPNSRIMGKIPEVTQPTTFEITLKVSNEHGAAVATIKVPVEP
ncbi:hypothetical protein [Neorhizobium galegae]|uniref:hypothetical protein n=1 Tax=Neorhizobium galegae TaxID=399 RepID=UPI002102D39E|nr:hypothetical protein [Neorhizobium galegae]MCQ1834858.1 hypothetical protein [Neorhizobium galegae]UIY29686.1 hypothetical protein LZK73_01885 [Neorhizobium galegae]